MDYDKLYDMEPDVPKPAGVVIPVLPDTEDIRELAKLVMPDAFRTIYKLMMADSTPPAIKKSCAELLIDRGFGKPAQSVEVQGKVQFEQLVIMRTAKPILDSPVIDAKVIE